MIEKDLIECYSDKKWTKEVEELFPLTEHGCINYGYWEQVPKKISLETREKSQFALYREVFKFAEIQQGKSVLEVGCGRGHGVFLLSQMKCDPCGIDISDNQIVKCKSSYPGLNFQVGNAENMNFRDHSFDCVVSIEAAQHFSNFARFCLEAKRVLRENGRLIVSTFFFQSPNAKERIHNYLPGDVSGYHHCIDIENGRSYMKAAGFRGVEQKSIGEKVFRGFSRWAKQEMSCLNHTPNWVLAYEAGLIDYYILKAGF